MGWGGCRGCRGFEPPPVADPDRGERHALCAAWYADFGAAEVEAWDLVARAENGDGDLQHALNWLCRSDRPSSGPLGRWLRHQEGRVVELTANETGTEPVTLKLTKRKGRAGRVKWAWQPLSACGSTSA